MPLICTLSPTTLTQYGRGAMHLLRLTFALLTFAIITGLFGLCNIINLSHADLGPPTTDDRIRAARKVTKFWLDTLDIGPAIATVLFCLYAIYRWTTSRRSVTAGVVVGVLAKVGLVSWWIRALHMQIRGDDWNVWKEYYYWTMYKTEGENPQRLYSQTVGMTRTNQPTHVFMVIGGMITIILLFTQLILELTLLYLQHSSWRLRFHNVSDSWLENAGERASLYSSSCDDENRLKTTHPTIIDGHSSSHDPASPHNQNRTTLTLYRPRPNSNSNFFHIPRTSTDAFSFWTSIRASSPRASTTTLPLFTETPMRRSLEAQLPGYAVTEVSSASEQEPVGLAQIGNEDHPPQSYTGSAGAASASASAAFGSNCSKSESGFDSSSPLTDSLSSTVEGSLHFSDRLDHLHHTDDHINRPNDAEISSSGPKVAVAAMNNDDVEALVARITAEQEIRFQRALEEQVRVFEAVLRSVREGGGL